MRLSLGMICLAAAAVTLPGCVGGNFMVRNAPVKIRTTPEGALATSEYGDSCTTPCTLRLRTSRGGMITIAKEGYEEVEVLVGSHHSDFKAVTRAIGHAIDPDPVDLGIDAVFTLFDPRGQDRNLNTQRVEVTLPKRGEVQPIEVLHASGEPETGGAGIVRLSREEVDSIRGAPLVPQHASAAVTPSGG